MNANKRKNLKNSLVLILILDPKQLWKFEEKILKNKNWIDTEKNNWEHKDKEWSTSKKGSLIYIQNDLKVLALKSSNKVELEVKDDSLIGDKDYRQLWRKGTPNIEGYFTLENYQSKTFMTATSDVDLEVKGLISNLNFPVLHLKRLFFRNSAVLAVCSVIKGF